MKRKAFVMRVKPGQHEAYRKRHNPIWPELEDTLKTHGVHNYSIFLHPGTNRLFAWADWRSGQPGCSGEKQHPQERPNVGYPLADKGQNASSGRSKTVKGAYLMSVSFWSTLRPCG